MAIGALRLLTLEGRAIEFELAYGSLASVHEAHADRALVDLPAIEHDRARNPGPRRLNRTQHDAKDEESRRQMSVCCRENSHLAW